MASSSVISDVDRGFTAPSLVPSAAGIPAEVRQVVADITRYPIDILELTADIEEELGIDSVKLGEILSVLRERYNLPPTTDLRTRFPASQLRTIGGIADAVVELAASAPVAVEAPAEPEAASSTGSLGGSVTGASLVEEVRQIFADLTRYPLHLLAADADLEDDLGIDSVKLGEIFSVLRERYALPPRADLRDKVTPAQLRTITGITEIVATFGSAATENAEPVAPRRNTPEPVVVVASFVEPEPPPIVAAPVETAATEPNARARTVTWSDPAIGASAAKTMAGIDYLRAVIRGDYPAPPIASLMDFTVTEVERGHVVAEVTPNESHYNPIGVVHGGLAATVLDSAMACAVHSTLPAGVSYATIELKINLVRPLTSSVGRLRAVADVIHGGVRIATVQARLLDDADVLYAHATETCLIVENGRRE